MDYRDSDPFHLLEVRWGRLCTSSRGWVHVY